MTVNHRLEVRSNADEKSALARRAKAEGKTVSALVRRGIRHVLGQPVRLEGEDALEVVTLRRRINAIADRLDALGKRFPDVDDLRTDIKRAHDDAQSLLGR